MKALIFSDLHVHHYKAHSTGFSRLDNTIGVIEYLYKLAAKNDINEIWFCGDMFDQFANVSVVAISRLLGMFNNLEREYPNMHFSAISGNHDFATKNMIEKPGESALYILEEHIFIVDHFSNTYKEPVELHGIPYYEDPSDFWAHLADLEYDKDATKHYLLMHQTIWPDNDMVQDDVNYNDNRFKRFEWVFNGHIHHPLMFNNFINVGSPLHRDAGDVGVKKGIWLLDTESDELPTFWDITSKNPQFIKKAYGQNLTEWEEEQYVVWFHPEDKKKTKEEFDSSKFNTELSPTELMSNFLNEIEPKLELPKVDLKKVGTKILSL